MSICNVARFNAALICFGLLLLATSPLSAAGAFAIGKCGAYGQAFDYKGE
ncbi:MAG: hypothetical protein JWP21_1729 [Tardiphaga sp.]|nr:hypothetical protein [Tardiphaga sp.]